MRHINLTLVTRRIYAHCGNVAQEVEDWCRQHQDRKDLRIALCGYEGTVDLGWAKYAWKNIGGANAKRHLERIWFSSMREHLLPSFDHSFSALLEDLEARGLLQDTLVVCMGEFGRAPLVAVERNFKGGSPGRKHWAQCYSVVLAGAGIRRGVVHGASDRHGAYPQSSPITPGDLSATLFHALGIPADTHFTDLTNRPHRVASGDPVAVLFG
jgi:hypothetical protein